MIRARIALFLVRHPTIAVIVALALLAVVAVGASSALSHGSAPAEPARQDADALVAPYTLPPPKESLDDGQAEPAHQALHALGRACKRPSNQRDPEAVLRPLRVIENFASQHPDAGFAIDDESGSTLTLLIVVRNELETCDSDLLPRIDVLIPSKYRPR